MKINFPKIVRPIDLGEYAAEMQGQVIHVWVNPPSNDIVAMAEFYKASLDLENLPNNIETVKEHLASIKKPTEKQKAEHEKMLAFYGKRLKELEDEKYKDAYDKYLGYLSSLLSQGSNKETHYSVEELRELEKASQKTDPAFWGWFQTRVIDATNDHRLGRKKV